MPPVLSLATKGSRESPLLVEEKNQVPATAQTTTCRSVNEFETSEDLRRALLSNIRGNLEGNPHKEYVKYVKYSSSDNATSRSNKQEKMMTVDMALVDQELDWVLQNFDPTTTRAQSVERELRRLLVLKSYLILDEKPKLYLDRLTKLAQCKFNCPTSFIGLMDLGRQWLLSTQGLGDMTEAPRKSTFCAHTLEQATPTDVMVVLDASLDKRFQNNPSVTGELHVRFYAGTPLISPEGEILGTLCVLDNKSRDSFGVAQKEELKAMAVLVVQVMSEHKRNMRHWFKNLVRTQFPDINDMEAEKYLNDQLTKQINTVDADEAFDSFRSDDDIENSFQEQQAFSKLADRISLKLLIQGLTKQHPDQQHGVETVQLSPGGDEEPSRQLADHGHKRCHFAQDQVGNVYTTVHEIESIPKDQHYLLWWTPQDMACEDLYITHYLTPLRGALLAQRHSLQMVAEVVKR